MKSSPSQTPKILLGLERIRKQIKPLLESPEGGRFLLIEGPEGTGRFDVASELAYEWSSHLPLVQEPDTKSGYSVEQIRTLCQEIQQSGLGAKKIVYILRNFELMPPVSANAWLKSLEDLPSHVWVIALALPSQVLPTLLSRALRLKTSFVSSETLKNWLQSVGYSFDEDQWKQIDLYAAGSAGRALAYFDEKVQKRLALILEFAQTSSWTQAQSLAKKIESQVDEDEGTRLQIWREIMPALAGAWGISNTDWHCYEQWLALVKEAELALSRHLKLSSILERFWIDKASFSLKR